MFPFILVLAGLLQGVPSTAADCVDSTGASRTLHAYFQAVSGPAGERDWTPLRAIVLPTARFDAIGIDGGGRNQYFPQSREEFLSHLGQYTRTTGFFQQAIDPQIRCARRVAQVWTRFESRNERDGAVIDQGWMGMHLVHDDTGWRIAHVFWNSEPQSPAPIPEIAQYLDEALTVIQANALTSRDVAWTEVRREVSARAATATTTAAAYPALRHALAALNDNHSFLQLSAELQAAEARSLGAEAAAAPRPRDARPPSPFGTRMRPEAEILEAGDTSIALVFMPQGRRDSAFATSFQQSLATLDVRRPCGWIVDLRGNGGGDMWPMLAGLGPLLGDGVVGGSVDASGRGDRWIYQRGEAIFEDASGVRKTIAAVADPVIVTAQSIAVLIDRGTASSGEAMALAFRGDPRARLFGERTYGASTATRGFKLSDGANLVIAVSTFVDRAGKVYPSGVTPDVEIPVPDMRPEPSVDAVLQRALTWLRARPSCSVAPPSSSHR